MTPPPKSNSQKLILGKAILEKMSAGNVLAVSLSEVLDELGDLKGDMGLKNGKELLKTHFAGSLVVETDSDIITLNQEYELNDFRDEIQLMLNSTREKDTARIRRERG